MIVEAFSKHQIAHLKPLILEDIITSIESNIYHLPRKNKDSYLLKAYKCTSGDYFGNKLLTINSLIENREKINMDELVFPERLVIIDKKIAGFTMKYIENNINLSLLLNSKNVSVEVKIELLKQIEQIIQKVQHVKGLQEPFLLGDIHESNFILERNSDKVYCVDLDGCKISNNRIYSMKYGSFNEKFLDLPHKYPLYEDEEPIPSFNTEWYCFTTMLLNMIGSGPVYKLLIEDFYDYIEYLNEAGFSKELLSCFVNIYSNKDNYSPKDLLDSIPKNISNVTLESFIEKKETPKLYIR